MVEIDFVSSIQETSSGGPTCCHGRRYAFYAVGANVLGIKVPGPLRVGIYNLSVHQVLHEHAMTLLDFCHAPTGEFNIPIRGMEPDVFLRHAQLAGQVKEAGVSYLG